MIVYACHSVRSFNSVFLRFSLICALVFPVLASVAYGQEGAEQLSAVVEPEAAAALSHEFVAEPSLDRVKELIELGTPNLAYFLIKKKLSDPSPSEDIREWMSLFYETAIQLEDWDGILVRGEAVLPEPDQNFYLTVQSHVARALIELGEHELARNQLRRLIWTHPYRIEDFILWQELIIQSYINMGNLEDARISMSLFSTDYRPDSPQFEHRYARLLILEGMYKEAEARLTPLKTRQSEILLLNAQLKSDKLSPSEVVQAGLTMTSELSSEPLLRVELWALIEQAAKQLKDFEMQIIAVESGLSVPVSGGLEPLTLLMIPTISVDYLIDIYNEYALNLGNSFDLLVGDDPSWQQLAQEFEITSPITARALHSFLAMNATDSQIRMNSIEALADSLYKEKLYRVLDQIFVESEIFDVLVTSETVKSNIAARTLRKKNYRAALKIMNSLEKPTDEKRLLLWYLRRTQTAILLEEYELALAFLLDLISGLPSDVESLTIDRILFVTFDLQKQNRHAEAIEVLSALYEHAKATHFKREILRWLAESYAAQDKNLEASEMLLRSAQLSDDWNDEWGQAARLKAADELVTGGLFEDARHLYEELKNDTLDPRGQKLIDDRLRSLPILH